MFESLLLKRKIQKQKTIIVKVISHSILKKKKETDGDKWHFAIQIT